MSNLARRHTETINKYHKRLSDECKRTKEHLKGKHIWISAALIPTRDKNGQPIIGQWQRVVIGGTYRRPIPKTTGPAYKAWGTITRRFLGRAAA